MIIIAAGVIITEQATRYESTAVSNLGELNRIDTISEKAESWTGNINPQSGEASSDYESETYRGGYGIITSIFSPLRVVFGEDGIVHSIAGRYGIPDYVTKSIVTMFSIAIIFGIVAIIFRLGRTSA